MRLWVHLLLLLLLMVLLAHLWVIETLCKFNNCRFAGS